MNENKRNLNEMTEIAQDILKSLQEQKAKIAKTNTKLNTMNNDMKSAETILCRIKRRTKLFNLFSA